MRLGMGATKPMREINHTLLYARAGSFREDVLEFVS